MSCIVYQTNKKTGITYAYESISYWDKEKGQPRSKRKYIGRVDDETGEIVTTRKGAAVKDAPVKDTPDAGLTEQISELKRQLFEKEMEIESLKRRLEGSEERYKKAAGGINQALAILKGIR